MNYSLTFFNKELQYLEFQDIEAFFINEKEESDLIEFKSYSSQYGNFNKNLEGIIRGICALLNSSGGILIWGAPEGTQKPGSSEKVFKGSLSPVKEYKEKDTLINKVSDSITPLPIGINVKTITQGYDYLYIFEVQESSYKPHQFKNTYWARLDGQTKPAPHYLVEALFRQIKYPNVEGFLKFKRLTTSYKLDIEVILFNFSQLQNEENVSFRLMCNLGTFVLLSDDDVLAFDGFQLVKEDAVKLLHYGQPEVFKAQIQINYPQLFASDSGEVEFHLTFSGKNSPVKISSYKLGLKEVDFTKTKSVNELIVEIEENKLLSQVQEEKGSNREIILRTVLER